MPTRRIAPRLPVSTSAASTRRSGCRATASILKPQRSSPNSARPPTGASIPPISPLPPSLQRPATSRLPNALADAEIATSLSALKYARYARGGRIIDPATQLSSYLDRKPQLLEPKTVLDQLAAAGEPDSYLRGLNPKQPEFEKLRQKYLEMRTAAAAAPPVTLPPGKVLVPGRADPQVALLRERLKVALPTATADKPADPNFYDDTLKAAVMAFQTESGTRADGVVGNATRGLLNDVEVLSPAKLLANMEEWRWMPEDRGDLYVTVNIPEFTLRIVKNGAVIHTERVITGLPSKQTPVFSETMKSIAFQPRWNVPNSIKVMELYPSLARGGTNFRRQGLRLSKNGRDVDPESVDWAYTDIRNYDVYQPPGASNVLGELKFNFPNKHTVYMHDTNARSLFEEVSRPFSHGCMRVRDPRRMAEILLDEDKGWDAAKIADLIANGPPEQRGADRPQDRRARHLFHRLGRRPWPAADGARRVRPREAHPAGAGRPLAADRQGSGPSGARARARERFLRLGGGFKSVGDFINSALGGGF